MVDTDGLTWPLKRRDDFNRIIAYIVLSTSFIFIIDVITPLGVMIWILYLIPLFLTVYLRWKYAPLVMTGVFILLMTASLFLSPRDISIEYALLNRAFFALILIIASVFIEDYIENVEDLALSEERYRHLIEWSPEGILVYRKEEIAYVNPAGVRFLGADSRESLTGRNITEMIDPESKTTFRERVNQAIIGARMNMDNIGLTRQDGSHITVDLSFAPVFWDKGSAIQIVIKNS
jgi:PAS domain S-box-containing protein